MTFPGAGILRTPVIEQHHTHVNTPRMCGSYTLAKPVEIGRIKLGEIEFRSAIQCLARTRPQPWMRFNDSFTLLIPSVFQYPQTNEVLVVSLKPI